MDQPAGKAEPAPRHGPSDEHVEQIIGNLLRVGVILSAVVVALGGVIYLARNGSNPAQAQLEADAAAAKPRQVLDIVRGASEWRGRSIIELGLLLLIATPIARVLFSVFAFGAQRDYVYVLITLLVLAILLYSLFSGYVH
jgi:uncharacterized membrane protein